MVTEKDLSSYIKKIRSTKKEQVSIEFSKPMPSKPMSGWNDKDWEVFHEYSNKLHEADEKKKISDNKLSQKMRDGFIIILNK